MKILIIEDNEIKYNHIYESLNRLLKNPEIVWMRSRNSGLVSIMIRNVKTKFEPYDLVICDNLLPMYEVDDSDIFECEEDVKPYAADIVRKIRDEFNLKELPIIICSSEEVEECDCNYIIKYNPSLLLDSFFKNIFRDLNVKINAENVYPSSEKFMNLFMEKLNKGEFKKVTCPQTGEEFHGTKEEIENGLKKYKSLLESGIIEQVTNNDKQLVKKLIKE